MLIVKLSTAATIEIGPVLDSTGVGVEYSGLAITELRLVKNGTGAAMASAASITHVANGHYTLVMTTGNTDTLGTLTVSCHKVGYQMPRAQMMVVPAKVYDSIVAGSDNLEVDAIQLLGTAFANPTTAGLMDVNSKQFGGATVNATTSVTIPVSSTLATTGGAVASVTGNVGSVTGLTAANLDTTVSSRASQTSLDTLDDLVDTEVSAIKTKTDQLTFTVANQIDANSLTNGGLSDSATRSALGLATANLDSQIATLATPTNITAATGIVLSGVTHTGARIPNVTLTDTATNLTNAATSGDLTATMKSSVTTAVPTVSQTADQVWDELLSGHTGAGSTGAGLSAAGAAGDPWSTALPGAYGAGTAGKIVGDNVNATISSRASQTSLDTLDDLVDTEVGAIKTKTDQLTFTVANQIDANSLTNGGLSASATRSAIGLATANLDTQIGTLATPTNITAATGITVSSIGANVVTASALATDAVNEIADQVWDELLSGHTGVGSTGAGLSAAGAAGDPWSTLIPGAYGSGTAGKIVGDNVNATISSRASQTSLDTLDDIVDTEVAAIKTKTDQMTFTVANQIDANSLTNGGMSASATRSALGLATNNLDSQISGLATPTNITAASGIVLSPVTHTGARIPNVTLTDTTTNLTNAATSGDLTQTMKNSVTAIVPTAAENFAAVLTTALTESYAADNVAPTLAQAIMLIQQSLHEFAINSTTRTVKKLDGSTTAATFTLDSATAPTSTTRAT